MNIKKLAYATFVAAAAVAFVIGSAVPSEAAKKKKAAAAPPAPQPATCFVTAPGPGVRDQGRAEIYLSQRLLRDERSARRVLKPGACKAAKGGGGGKKMSKKKKT